MKMPRRFIAGAICPQCKEADKTVAYHNDDGDMVRECVRCGFVEVLVEEEESPLQSSEELTTRVNKPNRLQDTPEQVVTIVDPGSLRKDH